MSRDCFKNLQRVERSQTLEVYKHISTVKSSITLGNPSQSCCLIPVCDPLLQVHSDQTRSSGGVGVGPHTLCNFKGDSCRSLTSKYQSGLGLREDFKRFARWPNYVKLKWIGLRFCDSESNFRIHSFVLSVVSHPL